MHCFSSTYEFNQHIANAILGNYDYTNPLHEMLDVLNTVSTKNHTRRNIYPSVGPIEETVVLLLAHFS